MNPPEGSRNTVNMAARNDRSRAGDVHPDAGHSPVGSAPPAVLDHIRALINEANPGKITAAEQLKISEYHELRRRLATIGRDRLHIRPHTAAAQTSIDRAAFQDADARLVEGETSAWRSPARSNFGRNAAKLRFSPVSHSAPSGFSRQPPPISTPMRPMPPPSFGMQQRVHCIVTGGSMAQVRGRRRRSCSARTSITGGGTDAPKNGQ